MNHRYDDARAALRRALDQLPNSPANAGAAHIASHARLEARLRLNLSLAALACGDASEAEAQATMVLEDCDPDSGAALLRRGLARARLGQ